MIARGREAQALLEHPLLQEALAEARATSIRIWLGSSSPEAAAAARDRHLAVDDVVGALRRYAGEGAMEEGLLRKRQ